MYKDSVKLVFEEIDRLEKLFKAEFNKNPISRLVYSDEGMGQNRKYAVSLWQMTESEQKEFDWFKNNIK